MVADLSGTGICAHTHTRRAVARLLLFKLLCSFEVVLDVCDSILGMMLHTGEKLLAAIDANKHLDVHQPVEDMVFLQCVCHLA